MKLTVIPIVIGALGIVINGLVKCLVEMEIKAPADTIQTVALLRLVEILRKKPGKLRRIAIIQTPVINH